ncbi:MAG: hypothetical protein ACRD3O_07915, partial [Terriglobia bacterium]
RTLPRFTASTTSAWEPGNSWRTADINQESFISPLDNAGVCYGSYQTSDLETSTGGNALASFLLGAPTSAGERNVFEREHGGWEDGFYFQDQWRRKAA